MIQGIEIQYTCVCVCVCVSVYTFVYFVFLYVCSVGIATRYDLDGPGIKSCFEGRFSAPVQTGPGAPPSLLCIWYRVFPGDKATESWR